MKMIGLLLLVLICTLHSKPTICDDQINPIKSAEYRITTGRELQPQEISIDDFSQQNIIRIKRHLSIVSNNLESEPNNIDRSSRRRKRAVLQNKNKIFYRRRKKKLERKSKIRRSLLRRGKFTLSTRYRRLRKYVAGKGKIAKPPGLKYRKRYRFNSFKKTQDVALGVGQGGKAPVQRSAPKKRARIHIKDYIRGRGTRKALRGRVGSRKTPENADQRRRGARKRFSVGDAAVGRANKNKPQVDYYDDNGGLSDYSSEFAKDSLPRQTKARTTKTRHGSAGRKTTITMESDSRFAYSSEDNTLLLSDEEHLTDVSSEIEALRSDLSDNDQPKLRKNASSSEYQQYSFAEDDSAIVKGEAQSSKDESLKRASFMPKTTILGPIEYNQYDIKKLDASMERAFKKKKSAAKKHEPDFDDPFEAIEGDYKDESSAEYDSDTDTDTQKKAKQKSQKAKPQSKKAALERKTKSPKVQSKAKSDKRAKKSDSYDSIDDDYGDKTVTKRGKQSKAKLEKVVKKVENDKEDYTSDEHKSDHYSSYVYDSSENSTEYEYSDDDYEYSENSTEDYQSANSTYDDAYESSENSTEYENGSDDYSSDYESDYDYTEHVTPSTPLRRIPSWKYTRNSKQETLYEEYTDTEHRTPDSKLSGSKSKKKSEPKVSLKEQHSDTKKQKNLNSKSETTIRKTQKAISMKTTSKAKSDLTKSYESSDYESSEYDSNVHSDSSKSHDKHSKKNVQKKTTKLVLTNSYETSDYESSEYHSNVHSDSSKSHDKQSTKDVQKKTSSKSDTKSKKTVLKKDSETSTYNSDEYYTDDSDETDTKPPKRITKSQKTSTRKKPAPKKRQETSQYDESEYDSQITSYEEDHSDQTNHRVNSYVNENQNQKDKSIKAPASKTTLKITKTKRGFTTVSTKGFDSAEAMIKISSKAAAITKKHAFLYNAKKKAYELVEVKDSSPIIGKTLQVTVPRRTIAPQTLLPSAEEQSTSSVTTAKTLKRRVVYKKTTPAEDESRADSTVQENATDDLESTKKRSRTCKSTLNEVDSSTEVKTTRKRIRSRKNTM